MNNDNGAGLALRLKAAAALVAATLRHPTKTSRIVLDPEHCTVHVEYEDDNARRRSTTG